MSELEQFMSDAFDGCVRMDSVQPRQPDFLWFPYLRKGNMNLISGNGGAGKTSLFFAIAAALSHGKQPVGMPGELRIDRPRTTVYFGREDSLEEYRALFDRFGGDPHFLVCIKEGIYTLDQTSRIEGIFRHYDAALFLADPIQSFLPPGIDMNSANAIRQIMDGLREVCRRTECTMVNLGHLNKSTKVSNFYRASGSMDLVNASRSVLFNGWLPDGQRVCGHLKSNNAPYGPGILYEIDSTGRFLWRGAAPEIKGEDVLAEAPSNVAARVENPYRLLALALVADGGAWEGTASEAVALAPAYGVGGVSSPEAFGKTVRTLDVPGVRCTAKRTNRGTIYRLEAAT